MCLLGSLPAALLAVTSPCSRVFCPCLQLLACLRVIVATAEELRLVQRKKADPLAGPLNPENEEQALRTLHAALHGLLEPLLPGEENGAAAGGSIGGSGGAAAADEQAGRQLGELHLQPGGEGPQPQAAQQEGGEQANENGFDADWRMSRRFCQLYVEGQRHILRRSLRECAALLQALQPSA